MENYVIAAACPDLQVANVPYNVQKIKEEMDKNADNGVRVMLFPRLCLSGVTCGDLFFQKPLQSRCLEALKELIEYSSSKRPVFLVGLPLMIAGVLCDVAVAFSRGKLLGAVPNACLSHDDCRHFSLLKQGCDKINLFGYRVPCAENLIFNVSNKKLGVLIGDYKEGIEKQAISLKRKGVDILLHLSSDVEGIGKANERGLFAKRLSADGVAYLCANPSWGESTSVDVYSGQHLYAENGTLYGQTKPFSGECLTVDVNAVGQEIFVGTLVETANVKMPFFPKGNVKEECRLILDVQAHALAKRLAHARAKTAVIGVSGGLDSTLALLVVDRAFDILKKDKKEIIAITMPGFGTTGKTKSNALTLIDEIGATSRTIDIQDSVLQHFKDIGHDKEVLNTTYENAQARMRTLILMDIANATGGIVVGTGDLSEAALGWCTYNGDHMSMYSVNATLPKTLIRKVIEEVAVEYPKVMKDTLLSVLHTEVSPELLPPTKEGKISQKTEELVGPYDLLDFFLYHAIGTQKTPKETYSLAKQAFWGVYNSITIKKWLKNFYRRFFTQQFKRSCAPDGANVGTISFAPTKWRMPADACVEVWMEEIERI